MKQSSTGSVKAVSSASGTAFKSVSGIKEKGIAGGGQNEATDAAGGFHANSVPIIGHGGSDTYTSGVPVKANHNAPKWDAKDPKTGTNGGSNLPTLKAPC